MQVQSMVDDFGEPHALPVSLTEGEVNVYTTQSLPYTHERQLLYRSP